jgi:peptidoglycan/LPS O-acetylase OafA/YrhL
MAVFLLVILLLMFFNKVDSNYTSLFCSFIYVYNFLPKSGMVAELEHTWSLGVEEQYYLIWPFLITKVKKASILIAISLCLILICLLIKKISLTPINFLNTKNFLLENFFYVQRWFLPAALPIILGAIGAIVMVHYERLVKPFFSNNFLLFVSFLLLYGLQIFNGKMSVYVIMITQPLSISLLILWIVFNQSTFIVRILEFYPFALIGKMSYGLYVYQGLFLRNEPGGNMFIQQFPLNIFLLAVVSIISYFYFEKRVLNLKSKFY